MKNKSGLIEFILFLLFFVILSKLFLNATWIFRSNDLTARSDITDFKNQKNIDVVVIGSSDVNHFYQPLKAWNDYGFTAYNYATYCQRSDMSDNFIEDSRLTNEALLYVVDLSTISRTYDTVSADPDGEAVIRNWSDSLSPLSPVRIRGITGFLNLRDWEEQDLPAFYLDIIKYHTNTEALGNKNNWIFMDRDSVLTDNQSFRSEVDCSPQTRYDPVSEKGELTDIQLAALDEVTEYCDRENLNVLYVITPYSVTEDAWRINNACGDYLTSKGKKFVDFNRYYDEIGLDFESDYRDRYHVNYIGSCKFTDYLNKYIKENYDLPDHRGDDRYDIWQHKYDDYVAYTESDRWYTENAVAAVANSREEGPKLAGISDFDEWYDIANNENFVVAITKQKELLWGKTDDEAFNDMVDKLEITEESAEGFVGAWSGRECIHSGSGEEYFEAAAGEEVLRGDELICITAGGAPSIMIDDMEYAESDRLGIHLAVYDRYYYKVWDAVTLNVDPEGNVNLSHFDLE